MANWTLHAVATRAAVVRDAVPAKKRTSLLRRMDCPVFCSRVFYRTDVAVELDRSNSNLASKDGGLARPSDKPIEYSVFSESV